VGLGRGRLGKRSRRQPCSPQSGDPGTVKITVRPPWRSGSSADTGGARHADLRRSGDNRDLEALREVLAEPWRRLAASATDALVLLAIHVITVPFALSTVQDRSVGRPAWLPWASFSLGWVYAWLGWGLFGATVGKALWGIRVVAASGRPMTLGRSALRCLGYAIACLPLRMGLLPILWHSRRQGWHDQIAGTLVIKSRARFVPEIHSQGPEWPEPTIPDLSAPARGWWWPLLIYAAVALVMTFPLVMHFHTHRPGGPGDGSVFMWNYWHFSRGLTTGQPVTETDLICYPQTISLRYHTMQWFNCVLALPLLRLVSLTATCNLLHLLTLIACAMSMYWVACAISRDRAASLVAGLVFGFSPYFASHGMGHPNLLAAQFLPWLLLLLHQALILVRVRYAVAAGVALALAGFCDWYYLVIGVVGMLVLMAGVQVGRGRPRWSLVWRQAALLALALALAVVLLSPLLVPMVAARRASHHMDADLYEQHEYKASLLDFVTPWSGHPLLGSIFPDPGAERQVAPGVVIILACLLGLRLGWRRLYPWALVGVVGVVLACGASLGLATRREGLPVGPALLMGGIPGSGLSTPLAPQDPPLLCSQALKGVRSMLSARQWIVLPFDSLARFKLVFGPFKVPSRFAVLMLLGAGVFAAVGLSALRRWAQDRWGRRGARLVLLTVGGLVAFEYFSAPYPLFPTAAHRFYQDLGQVQESFAIVEVPLACHTYQLYQTVHQKHLFSGHVSREPPNAGAFISQNEFLRLMNIHYFMSRPPEPVELPLAEVEDEDLARGPVRRELEAALQQVADVDGRYILIHKPYVGPRSLRKLERLLHGTLALPVVWDDQELRVYAIEGTRAGRTAVGGVH